MDLDGKKYFEKLECLWMLFTNNKLNVTINFKIRKKNYE